MSWMLLLQIEAVVQWLSEELELGLCSSGQIFTEIDRFSISDWNPIVGS
jgi:hypothetical protein